MFRRDLLPMLEREKRMLEAYDCRLAGRLNEERLLGQITFECGSLLNWSPEWSNLSVLDIGRRSSLLPRWMVSQGASVLCFEFPGGIESEATGGALEGITPSLLERPRGGVKWVYGNMLELPFRDNALILLPFVGNGTSGHGPEAPSLRSLRAAAGAERPGT